MTYEYVVRHQGRDYSGLGDDFVQNKDWSSYTAEEHDRWRRLYMQQRPLAERHACTEYLEGLLSLDCAGSIPDLERTSELLRKRTGWSLVGVPGIIPDKVFFRH